MHCLDLPVPATDIPAPDDLASSHGVTGAALQAIPMTVSARIRQVVVVAAEENMEAAWQLIRYRHPQAVALIGPYASGPRAAEFQQSLFGVPIWRRWETGHRHIASIYRRLKRHKLEVPGPEVEVCLNSGPFAVRLAAMQWAQEVGARISLLSLPQRAILDVNQTYPPEPMDGRLEAFLDSRGSRLGPAGTDLIAEHHVAAAEFLAGHLQDWHAIITWLRLLRDPGTVRPGSVPLAAMGPLSLDQAQLHILHQLQELHIVDRLHIDSDRLEVHFVSEAARKFVNGIWLEVFLYGRLLPLFDDCRWGQTLRWAGHLREVDFIGLAQGRLAIASCKTSLNPFDVRYLEELQAWSTQLERLECSRFFVTDSSGHSRTESGREFEAFAERKGIIVVQGNNLQQVQDVVGQAMRL